MISLVGEKTEPRNSETRTLGDLLYGNKAKFRVPEKDWVALIRAIAVGDQVALHSLYERTHRIVFTLIARITNNPETAEELTVDVFYDVWRSRKRICCGLDYESSALPRNRSFAVRTSEKTGQQLWGDSTYKDGVE